VEHFNHLTVCDSFMVLLSNVDFTRIYLERVCWIIILTMSSNVNFYEYALSTSHLSTYCGTNSNHIDNYDETHNLSSPYFLCNRWMKSRCEECVDLNEPWRLFERDMVGVNSNSERSNRYWCVWVFPRVYMVHDSNEDKVVLRKR
jgi:hypothetical protein